MSVRVRSGDAGPGANCVGDYYDGEFRGETHAEWSAAGNKHLQAEQWAWILQTNIQLFLGDGVGSGSDQWRLGKRVNHDVWTRPWMRSWMRFWTIFWMIFWTQCWDNILEEIWDKLLDEILYNILNYIWDEIWGRIWVPDIGRESGRDLDEQFEVSFWDKQHFTNCCRGFCSRICGGFSGVVCGRICGGFVRGVCGGYWVGGSGGVFGGLGEVCGGCAGFWYTELFQGFVYWVQKLAQKAIILQWPVAESFDKPSTVFWKQNTQQLTYHFSSSPPLTEKKGVWNSMSCLCAPLRSYAQSTY